MILIRLALLVFGGLFFLTPVGELFREQLDSWQIGPTETYLAVAVVFFLIAQKSISAGFGWFFFFFVYVWAGLILSLVHLVQLDQVLKGQLTEWDLPWWSFHFGLIVLLFCMQASWSRRIILRSIPEHLEFMPADMDDFPQLDHHTLESYTESLEALGFVRLLDYCLKTEKQNYPSGYARMWYHPRHQCLLEINQVFPPPNVSLKKVPMRAVVLSTLEQGWILGTTNREPSSYSYALRRPRALVSSHPHAALAELLTLHLERRGQLAEDLGLKVVTSSDPEVYFTREREANQERKECVLGRNCVVNLVQAWWFDLFPRYAWMGEYGASGRASRRW